MKFPLTALLLMLAIGLSIPSPGQQSGSPARVRWIIDLKKNFGFDDFDRARSSSPWKQQQGVAFIAPNEILVYQLLRHKSPAGAMDTHPAEFTLLAGIFDAHDGREIKSLRLEAQSATSSITPTRAGEFMVRSGEMLTVYSSSFQPVKSRELPLSKTATAQEWQVDVSPSGSRIIAVHQQAWKNAEPSAKADIEILDSETLKTIKSLTVNHLDRWSAEDDAIITTDPNDDEPEDTEMGIMDFEGNWREIHTHAESYGPDCPYGMQTLDHHWIAAHDCDDLVVVSRDGRIVFSHPTGGTEFILSTVGSDQYLAEIFGQPGAAGSFVRVYNLISQQPVLWVSLEKNTAFYSVSPSGSLAVVESGKLKLFESSLVADCSNGRFAPSCMAEFVSILN